MADFGAWSLLPPGIAIVTAMLTRRVYQSLVLGIVVAGVMVAGAQAFTDASGIGAVAASLTGGFMAAVEWTVDGVADPGHAAVIAFTLFLGALVALMQKSGGVRGFGEAAMKFADTHRRAGGLAWGVGALFLAIDDYFHVIAAGSIFRPVTDRVKMSREKLAYIIDSTAAPMVILVPISTWVGFILGIVSASFADSGVTKNAFATFLEGIPFNFYAILTVAFVGVVALTRIEFGPMRTAERRAQQGKLLRDGARPLVSRELAEMAPEDGVEPRARNLALPVLFLFATAILMLYATGHDAGDPDRDGFFDALQNARAELSLAIASFLALLFAMVLYQFQGVVRQDRFTDTVLDGFKAMVPALAILGLAWGIGNAVGDDGVGLGAWLSDAVSQDLSVAIVPLLAFTVSAVIAFATGTSFGTFSIMLPITLGIAAGADTAWLAPALAATVGGAVFGDHCSPISDTTVMSSMAGHCDHIDHVKTQLPYAVSMAVVAAAGYTVLWLTESLAAAWAACGVLFLAVFTVAWLAGGRPENRGAGA